jgi:hypothetical protein
MLAHILHANTVQEVAELATMAGSADFFDQICRRVREHGLALLCEGLALEVFLIGNDGRVLGSSR